MALKGHSMAIDFVLMAVLLPFVDIIPRTRNTGNHKGSLQTFNNRFAPRANALKAIQKMSFPSFDDPRISRKKTSFEKQTFERSPNDMLQCSTPKMEPK